MTSSLKIVLKVSGYLLVLLQLIGLTVLGCQLLFFRFDHQIFHLLVQLQIYLLISLLILPIGVLLLCLDQMFSISLGHNYLVFFWSQANWLSSGLNPIILSLTLIGAASFLTEAIVTLLEEQRKS